MMTIAQQFAQSLKDLGIRYVFGVPSGNWVDYMEAIRETKSLEFILITNEASAGFMADVCWRLTGQIAACFGTFGPGACNLSTGVCGGYLDRSPMLIFTDEMSDEMRPRITQMNIDHQKLFEPITKWTGRIEKDRVKEIIFKAYHIAISEVPGPVHIGLPAGIGLDETKAENLEVPEIPAVSKPDSIELDKMKSAFIQSQKPIIALGVSSIRAEIQELILKFAEKYKIPVVITPMAKGMLPEEHPSYVGVLAHALGNIVGETHQQADLILGIGYDPVEINYEDWMPNVPLIHIDTMKADLDQTKFKLAANVVGDISFSLSKLIKLDCPAKNWDINEIESRKNLMFDKFKSSINKFGTRAVLEQLQMKLPKNTIMTCDVGAHLHLIGQMWKISSPENQLMTNGCSSMGFAMPAAIAAKLSKPDREVCCVMGDGGFAMMAGELLVAKRLKLKIVFVVLRDDELALIRIKQKNKSNSKYGVDLDSKNSKNSDSNFMFGVPVFQARNEQEFKQVLDDALNEKGSSVIEALIDPSEYDELVLKGNR